MKIEVESTYFLYFFYFGEIVMIVVYETKKGGLRYCSLLVLRHIF